MMFKTKSTAKNDKILFFNLLLMFDEKLDIQFPETFQY